MSLSNLIRTSEKNMMDVIALRNLNAFYKQIEPYIIGSFENKPDGKSDYDMFIKLNLANEYKTYIRKQQTDNGGVVVPYQCIISQGSLPSIELEYV